MTDWSRLYHAFGPATDVPALLADLSPDETAPVWGDLWTCLCHQGTVYSASFAALPALAEAAAKWNPEERTMALYLAAMILVGEVVGGNREELLRPVEWVVPELRRLAAECLSSTAGYPEEFVYRLQVVLVLEDDELWGPRLGYLADGEFPESCPTCGADLYIVIGKYGFFTAAEHWLDRPNIQRIPIVPHKGNWEGVALWMREQAQRAGQADALDWLSYLFGTGTCPSCRSDFAVPDAIALG